MVWRKRASNHFLSSGSVYTAVDKAVGFQRCLLSLTSEQSAGPLPGGKDTPVQLGASGQESTSSLEASLSRSFTPKYAGSSYYVSCPI